MDVDAGPWTDLRMPEGVVLTERTWPKFVQGINKKMTKNALQTTDPPVGTQEHVDWWNCTEQQAREAHGWQSAAEEGIQRWWWSETRELFRTKDPIYWLDYNDTMRGAGYVLVNNFLLWADGVGHDVVSPILDWVKSRGPTPLTRNQYFEGLKPLLAAIKRVVMDPGLRCKVSECHILSGYLLTPPEGFDMAKESQLLAEGGEMCPHGLGDGDWPTEFAECVKLVLEECQGHRGTWVPFREYVESLEWATSGSSSLGKLEFTVDGTDEKVKARKNLVPYLFTTDELMERVAKRRRQQSNTVVLKKEPGKVRVVVASDLESYLVASWLLKITGHVYTKGLAGGITLDETVSEIVARTVATADDPDTYVLPFDFKSYDHQPTTEEVQIIVKLFDEVGASQVPPEGRQEWKELLDDHIAGFANATLHVHTDKRDFDIKITGGVMSGWRETSLVGNIWNAAMMKAAERTVAKLSPTPLIPKKKYIRGDDSYLTFDTYTDTLLYRVGIAAVGALGADQKYSINKGEGEFLRVWHARKVASGYVPRAIVGLTQRKPWANEPWTVGTDASTSIETARVLERRVWAPAIWQESDEPLTQRYTNIAAQVWSRKYRQSKHYLALPRYRGGLGLTDYTDMVSTKPFPKDEVVLPIATTGATAQDDNIASEYHKLKWNIDVPKVRERKIAQIMTADDVRGYADKVRRETFKRTWELKSKWTRHVSLGSPELYKDIEMDIDLALRRLANGVRTPLQLKVTHEEVEGISYSRGVDMWREANRQGVEKRGLREWTREVYPETWKIIEEHTTRGWHIAEAVDLVLGKTPAFVSTKLHPLLRGAATAAVWNKHLSQRGGRYVRHKIMDIAGKVSSNIAGRPYQYITSMLW